MLALKRASPILCNAIMSLRRSARNKVTSESLNGKVSDEAPKAAPTKALKKRGGKAKKTAVAEEVVDVDKLTMPPPPSTPSRKRKHTESITPAKPPPLTPTPSGVGLIANPVEEPSANGSQIPKEKRARKARPVEPHMTNAPLSTPRGTKVVGNPLDSIADEDMTSSQKAAVTTTENLLEKANAHLIAVDPSLKSVIEQNYCKLFSPEGLEETIDPFRALVSGICGQQVSGAAAKSIRDKFVKLYNEDNEEAQVWPTPAQVAATDLTRLRTAGLSQRKAEYIQGLAQKFVDGELSAKLLAEGSDEELLERLIAVRGLGRWSVEMFLTFALKRTDILSTGDLGVQRGMAAYMGRDVAKLKAKGGGKWKYMSEQDMLDISAKFSPYRTLFMWYMWRIENVDIDVMEKT